MELKSLAHRGQRRRSSGNAAMILAWRSASIHRAPHPRLAFIARTSVGMAQTTEHATQAAGTATAQGPRRQLWPDWWDAAQWGNVRAAFDAFDASGNPARFHTGPFFWAALLAQYPRLQRINLVKMEGHWAVMDDAPVTCSEPGGGHDMWLQEFRWSAAVGPYARSGLITADAELYHATHKCACG